MKSIVIAVALLLGMVGVTRPAMSSTNNCEINGPPSHFRATNNIRVFGVFLSWRDCNHWGGYNVRYGIRGERERQKNLGRNGRWGMHIEQLAHGREYVFRVQGCNKSTFGRSKCSGWNTIYKTIDYNKHGQ